MSNRAGAVERIGRDEVPLIDRAAALAGLGALLDTGAQRRAVVLTGTAGLGRTRLARAWLDAAGQRGCATGWVTATRAAATVPLGALAPLLPELGRSGGVGRLNAARRLIAGTAGTGTLALAVDDAHLLDPASATVLHQIAEREPGVRLLLTVRTGEAAPDVIRRLWKDGHAALVELSPLDEDGTGQLVAAIVAGPVATGTRHLLWRWTGGNPLLGREVVLSAVTSGVLREDGVWHLVGQPVPSPRLRSIVDDQLGDPSDAERAALGAIAVGISVDVSLVEQCSSPAAVEALDAKGLLAFEHDGSRRRVRLTLPAHQSTLRAGMTTTHLATVARLLADAAEAGPGRPDRRQIAVWRLDSDGEPEPRALLDAAHAAAEAREPHEALRLARAAAGTGQRGLRSEASLLVAQILLVLGHHEEALGALEAVADLDDSDEHRAAVAAAGATARFWGLGQRPEAERLLTGALAAVSNSRWRRVLRAQQAELCLANGELDTALALVTRDGEQLGVGGHGDGNGDGEVTAAGAPDRLAVVASLALTLDGRCEESTERLDAAGPGALAATLALAEAGRLADAEAACRPAIRAAVESGDVVGQANAAMVAGRTALARGLVQTGRRWFAEAVALYGALGFDGPRRWALGGRALCEATAGSAVVAQTLALIDGASPAAFMLFETEVVRARAWARAVGGDERGARELLREAADDARRRGAHVLAEAAVFDLARLGSGGEARDRLAEHTVDGPLAAARRAFAAAIAAVDGPALDRVSHDFEAIGAALFAAEAAAAGAAAHRRAGAARAGRQSTARATQLAGRCEGARTPLLALAGPVVVLTEREREVAGHAARGASNRDIAEQLDLSVRTVENNLQRIYLKLGAVNRAELAKLLGRGGDDYEAASASERGTT